MLYIGIDPGISGAIAFLNFLPGGSIDVWFEDMPVLKVAGSTRVRSEYDEDAIASKLRSGVAKAGGGPVLVAIEVQSAMPNFRAKKQQPGEPAGKPEAHSIGVSSSFAIGTGWGVLRGVCGGLGLPRVFVSPRTWKAKLMRDCPKEKDASIAVAKRMFPQSAEHLARKKDHARAEALLIAEYARRQACGA